MSGTSSDDHGCTPEKFDRLLIWLNPDRKEAAKQYGEIEFRLFKSFERRLATDGHSCADADILASRTMDRICPKMPELADGYEGNPVKYFFGVAKHIYQEYMDDLRKQQIIASLMPHEEEDSYEKERRDKCLKECLERFSKEDRDLLLQYFQDEKRTKIDLRKELAEKFKIPGTTLRVRIYRLKETLGKCIFDCMKKAEA